MRRYRPGDEPSLSAIYRAAVRAIGSRCYSPQQVEAWIARTPSPERIASLYSDGRTALVAVDAAGSQVAFSDAESDGHIHFLYCSTDAAGPGVAYVHYDRTVLRSA